MKKATEGQAFEQERRAINEMHQVFLDPAQRHIPMGRVPS